MTLEYLELTHFRNLMGLKFSPSSSAINIIHGENGSGKTSILEAIHWLACGKSFRTSAANAVINYKKDHFVIFSRMNDGYKTLPMAIEKKRGKKQVIAIEHDRNATISQLAKQLPVQILTPHCFYFLALGPEKRRQYLDWGLFHVEPNFYNVWSRYKRVIQQRNAALKNNKYQTVAAWDEELISYGQQLSGYREAYVAQLEPYISQLIRDWLPGFNVALNYNAGWNQTLSFEQALKESKPVDMHFGFTNVGPHRADLVLKINNFIAHDILSRGQQKLLVCALKLAQLVHLKVINNKNNIFLIDDVASELDQTNRNMLLSFLQEHNSQIFLTCLNPKSLDNSISNKAVFHVEQLLGEAN